MRLTRLSLFALALALVPSAMPAQSDPHDATPAASLRAETVTDTLSVELRASSALPRTSLDLEDEGRAPEGPAFPIEFALVGLATARKTAAKKGGKKKVGTTVNTVTPATPPATAPRLTAAQRKTIETAQAAERDAVVAARAPAASPKESENIKATGKFDETVKGGRYVGTDKKVRNANGEVIDE